MSLQTLVVKASVLLTVFAIGLRASVPYVPARRRSRSHSVSFVDQAPESSVENDVSA